MASSPKALADPIDARLVRKLADILTETGLTEIEVEHNDLKIRVAKTAAPAAVQYAPAPAAYAAAPAPAAAPVTGEAAPAAVERKGDVVKSPMVGTVYLQPQPGAPGKSKEWAALWRTARRQNFAASQRAYRWKFAQNVLNGRVSGRFAPVQTWIAPSPSASAASRTASEQVGWA